LRQKYKKKAVIKWPKEIRKRFTVYNFIYKTHKKNTNIIYQRRKLKKIQEKNIAQGWLG
jgi:hypothetical protein